MICPSCREENDAQAAACFSCGHPFTAIIRRGALVDARYEVRERLGSGGMGTVYKAYDRVLEETVALKILRPEIAGSPEMARRFRSEIKLARRVRHPNVCGIHEYGEDRDLRYISMELIEGTDLKQIVQSSGALSPEEAYEVAIQLAEGLRAIHEVGIIHRDLKTANVMRDGRGRVRLMDFGIAKQLGVEATAGATGTGHILGTPEYMSPEQARSQPLDPRTDIYALGIVIFEIFTGRVPFHGDTPVATLLKHLQDPPPLDAREGEGIPAPLVMVLRKALAKDPADRYATTEDLAGDLRRARAQSAAEPGATASASALAATVVPVEALQETLRTPPAATTWGQAVVGDATSFDLPTRPSPPPPPTAGSERLLDKAGEPALARPAAAGRPTVAIRGWLAFGAVLVAVGSVLAAIRLWPSAVSRAERSPAARAVPTSLSPGIAGVHGVPPTSEEPSPLPALTDRTASTGAMKAANIAPAGRPQAGSGAVPRTSAPVSASPARSATAVAPPPPPPARAAVSSPSPPPALTGVLQLVVHPWADVTVDGVSVGTTPFRPLPLDAGVHTVVFSHPGYKPFQKRVTVRPRETTRLEVDLAWEAFRR